MIALQVVFLVLIQILFKRQKNNSLEYSFVNSRLRLQNLRVSLHTQNTCTLISVLYAIIHVYRLFVSTLTISSSLLFQALSLCSNYRKQFSRTFKHFLFLFIAILIFHFHTLFGYYHEPFGVVKQWTKKIIVYYYYNKVKEFRKII